MAGATIKPFEQMPQNDGRTYRLYRTNHPLGFLHETDRMAKASGKTITIYYHEKKRTLYVPKSL